VVGFINVLGALTALACAVMLYRGYWRTGVRLLAWSALCFLALAVENGVLYFDRSVIPDEQPYYLVLVRQAVAAAGIACLAFSLIWETE
jgi:hypothetical protein